ncbi:MAG: GH-E family nuclease, partial [Actinomycetota bacterium]|nr:GH-E family nuclease [Actinomycetota bacterium]
SEAAKPPKAKTSKKRAEKPEKERPDRPERPEGSERPSVSQQPAEQRNFVKVDKGNDPQTAATCHSFAPDTRVLMADGTTRPIAEVNVGDKVTTTDPSTGQSSDQQVTLLHANRDRELTDVTVSTAPAAAPRTEGEGKGGRSTRGPTESTLETTAHHPFWDATAGAWVDAAELTPGTSTLVGPDGQIQYVIAVHNFTGTEVMRDLTVATTHTYYVLAGTTPVLVHNCGGGEAGHGSACQCSTGGRPIGSNGQYLANPNTPAPGAVDANGMVRGTNKPGHTTSRGGWRADTTDEAWKTGTPGPNGGVMCPRQGPNCAGEVFRNPAAGQPAGDMGHWPDAHTNRSYPANISRADFLDEYQKDVRIECIPCNRGAGNRQDG